MKRIAGFEVLVHGVEHSQFFQGCGVSFTPYTEVATGIGSDAREALDDALESLAQGDWDVEPHEDDIMAELPGEPIELPEDAHEDMHVFVSVRVRPVPTVKLDNMEDRDGSVLATVSGDGAAIWAREDDQTIGGSQWEIPDDSKTFAYAMPCDHPGLVAELEAEGYVLNLDEYSPPEAT